MFSPIRCMRILTICASDHPLISLQGTRSRNPGHSDHPCVRCAYILGRLVIFLDLVSFQNNPATPGDRTTPGTLATLLLGLYLTRLILLLCSQFLVHLLVFLLFL